MKFLSIKAFAILALLSVTGYSFGYEFGVTNATNAALIVKLQLRSASLIDPNYKYELIKPHEKSTFRFDGENVGMCLESIHVAPHKEAKGDQYETYALQSVDMIAVPQLERDEMVKGSKIAKAVRKLEENTLCKNREFTIVATGEKAVKMIGTRKITLPYDEYIAVMVADDQAVSASKK